MARGRRLKTLDDYARSLKNKYGLGEGDDYKPWLRVQDVPSIGLASKIQGMKANREHHTLSKLETEFFFLAEFSDVVIDIREQFPLLPLDLTVKISKTISVSHPVVPGTDTMHLMTTDFLLTCFDNEKQWHIAVSVKSEKDLRDKRVLEKLEIERLWWELLGVEFVLFCGTSETSIQSKNIAWVTDPIRHRLESLNKITEDLKENALGLIKSGKQSQEVICQNFLSNLELEGIDPLMLLKVLIAEKRLIADLTLPMIETGFISIIAINAAAEI
ncbi:TnsA endonuclease N-terminal domain-containing protein [Endozoicomonas ascidiicola]|uniref:TnsA endonuclease N-terminal domain-containing protein n=1 Tax=Endozoicomonas ascidiicola TaxID=1698521 RepID=UPI00082CA461|nr:TnsA endonuclease N-terminal domain-containing protein [Endozoicomonas ascidiicola]